jgi:hypothetical protein
VRTCPPVRSAVGPNHELFISSAQYMRAEKTHACQRVSFCVCLCVCVRANANVRVTSDSRQVPMSPLRTAVGWSVRRLVDTSFLFGRVADTCNSQDVDLRDE